jgi:hypothetical protein
MEMETEDDVLVEGSGDPSTSTTNLAGQEIQPAVIIDAEVANEELHSGAITL